MNVDKEVSALVTLLKEAADFLSWFEEEHWETQLKEIRQLLLASDFRGVERLLSLFGGTGSLNDLYIHPTNGHKLAVSEAGRVNAQLERMRTSLFDLAEDIRRKALIESLAQDEH